VEAFINEELAHLKLALDCKDLEIQVATQGMQHLQQRQAELQGQVQVCFAANVATSHMPAALSCAPGVQAVAQDAD
jgi:hypothetical protein